MPPLPSPSPGLWLTALLIHAPLLLLARRLPLLTPAGWWHAALLGTVLWASLGWRGWLAVVAYLMQLDLPWHALGVLGLSLAQVPLMQRFIAQPIERALSLSAFGVPLYVSGMMVSAWGLRSLGGVS